jgi:hypothetical protein
MIIERMTFQAKYGEGDALVSVFREFNRVWAKKYRMTTAKIYTDATGEMFTVIVDTAFKDMSEMAAAQARNAQMYADPAFGQWFARMQPLVRSGSRQLLNSVRG